MFENLKNVRSKIELFPPEEKTTLFFKFLFGLKLQLGKIPVTSMSGACLVLSSILSNFLNDYITVSYVCSINASKMNFPLEFNFPYSNHKIVYCPVYHTYIDPTSIQVGIKPFAIFSENEVPAVYGTEIVKSSPEYDLNTKYLTKRINNVDLKQLLYLFSSELLIAYNFVESNMAYDKLLI